MNNRPKMNLIDDDNKEEAIRINGREQILDLLRSTDPAFREHLLRNLERRDKRLAQELRASL